MKSVGIIGYGHFGKLLADKLQHHFQVRVYSASSKQNPWTSTLAEVAQSDYVALSLPLAKYKEVCQQLKPLLKADSVIIDVCSVKEESSTIIKKVLPDHRLLSTHPLFGPESAADSVKGHTIVLCPDMSDPDALKDCQKFCESVGLKIVCMSSQEHDKEMALVHGLTFFIARALKDFDLDSTQLNTPSFRKLMSLAELEQHHTKELFITIQRGNPNTDAVRKQFIERAVELQKLLSKEHIPD